MIPGASSVGNACLSIKNNVVAYEKVNDPWSKFRWRGLPINQK